MYVTKLPGVYLKLSSLANLGSSSEGKLIEEPWSNPFYQNMFNIAKLFWDLVGTWMVPLSSVEF